MSRAVISLGLLAIVAFCAFGFLATFEPPGAMGLRILYGAACVIGLIGVGRTLMAK